MARPAKNGLNYFPLDVDFFSDRKIRSIRANYGTDGIALYIYTLCEIYRGGGYYIKADDDFIDLAAVDLGIAINEIRQILKFFCKRSLFDDTLFTTDTILTAASVQQRYQEAKKDSKRDIFVDGRLWLLEKSETLGFIKVRPNSDYSEKKPSFSENNSSFSEENPTSKVKESKVEESKAEVAADAASASPTAASLNREYLVEIFGKENVDEYEQRYDSWKAKKGGKVRGNRYETILKMMKQDGVQKPESNSSFDMDAVKDHIMQKYNKG